MQIIYFAWVETITGKMVIIGILLYIFASDRENSSYGVTREMVVEVIIPSLTYYPSLTM